MKPFKQFFIEQTTKEKTVVFAYGRFNPPTTGHEKLINKVLSTASKVGGDYYIIPSHSIKPPNKNPLSPQEKINILKYLVTDQTRVGKFGTTFIDVLKHLNEMGYTKAIQIAGSDRQAEFLALVNKYNGKPDPKTGNVDFNFKTYEVVSSGERDPDSDQVEGMSGSKLRQYALNGDLESFVKGMSDKIPTSLKMSVYNTIRKNTK